MQPITDIIARKRDAQALTASDIERFIQAVTSGSASDAQIAAFAMAVVIQGMNREETVSLTLAMRDSGERLDWSDLPGPVVDKHSSGGVGDKVSLILAPLLAACGAFVPMISGRGLGHTGGTVDKLESLPGYNTTPDSAKLRRCVREAGCAIVGATGDLAPADRRIYAVRDLTSTVESLPLITASILAKKLAAGPQSLVMDIKLGNGAFCTGIVEARDLATSIVETANAAGLTARALITDMNQVLGCTAGNALELEEARKMLAGESGDERLRVVTLALAGELLALAGIVPDAATGQSLGEKKLASGAGLENFARMASALGCDAPLAALPTAPAKAPIEAASDGRVTAMRTRDLGEAVIDLGGGRRTPGAPIDHRVGLSGVCKLGDWVKKGEPLAYVHAADSETAQAFARRMTQAFTIGPEPAPPAGLIVDRIT